MAVITPTTPVFKEGAAETVALYRLKNVTDGDTLDVSAEFKKVINAAAVVVPAGVASFTVSVGISTTTLTFTATGMSKDTIYALVTGIAA